MRREQKKQAENFVKLLETAHDEIRNAIEKKDRKTALILLEDCQNGAIALGNLIEEAEGEGFVTVRLLEEYCEQIYRIYTSFGIEESVGEESGKRVRANQVYKMLRGAMTRIVNSVKRDIGISLEVVFLPYKASMWDSLESVWQAADADPGCNAYVIPIPYYDKKPDGSFGQLHDEGEQYPEYVPVMRYEDYNFEKRKPDMIFIHNPYDDCNYVTSVHPYFYSENLRKFTDNLVYIPYFILGEIHPDNLEELKGIEHFCMAPGVLNADKVIVQSEDMRKAYINVLLADIRKRTEERGQINKANPADGSEQEKHWDNRKYMEEWRNFLEKKILGLGSPKLDKALAAKKEKLELPEEWRRVIQKPSGEQKKIILYNTSVSALLQAGEAMISKMRRVFRIFQENQEDVALLWRPHPLIQATIESMRPQLWGEYETVVREYRKAGWGIYDDTPELDRAIGISDGYYGDPSSLVTLCRSAGMPVMIQSVEI